MSGIGPHEEVRSHASVSIRSAERRHAGEGCVAVTLTDQLRDGVSASRHARRAARARWSASWQALSQRIRDDLAADGLGARAAAAVFWFPVAGLTVLLTIFAVSRPLFYWVTQEDRLLEWVQFAVCLLASLLAAAAAARFARTRAWVATALMALFCAEMNVHNLPQLASAFKALEFLICIGGITLAVLVRWNPSRARPAVLRLLAPPLATVPVFAAMAGYQLAQALVFPDTWDAAARLQELGELGMYLGLAVLALTIYNRLHRSPGLPVRAGPGDRSARLPLALVVLVAAVTLVFAVLTALSGVQPGNT
jgi:hypothetical protein